MDERVWRAKDIDMETEGIKRAGAEIRLELIDNWHDRWALALSLVESLDLRTCLHIDEDGWLSARQNLIVAFVNGKPAGFVCFRVQPMLQNGAPILEDGRPIMEAVVDGLGVLPEFHRKRIGQAMLSGAMNRALELRCRKFHQTVVSDA